jgi:hypothetical protein
VAGAGEQAPAEGQLTHGTHHAPDRAWPRRLQRRIDCSVFSGVWLIGRIYEGKGFPDAVRFFWSLHGVALTRAPDIHTDGHTPSLEAAKAEFKSNWLRWLEWSERAEVE